MLTAPDPTAPYGESDPLRELREAWDEIAAFAANCDELAESVTKVDTFLMRIRKDRKQELYYLAEENPT